MKRASGKSNLDIVRGYLAGERPFTQIGYNADISSADKNDGETWKDSRGSTWVKKNGYRQRISNKSQFVLEQKCSICNADMKWGDYLDNRVYSKTTRCYDCNIAFESILVLNGLYRDYEEFKLNNNLLSQLKDFKSKLEDSIAYLTNYTKDTKDPRFFNEDGSVDTWVDDTDRRQIVLDDLKNDLKLTNEHIDRVLTELKEIKYDINVEVDIKKKTIEKINRASS